MVTRITKTFWKSFRFWWTSYYCRKYSDKFAHARKLFVMDVLLIIGACFILYLGITWLFLSPKTSLLDISFVPTPTRIVSGEDVSLDIVLQNTSENALDDVNMFLSVPDGYLINYIAINEQAYPTSSLKHLVYNDGIAAGEAVVVQLVGTLFGTVAHESPLGITARYVPVEGSTKELSFGRMLLTPRESVLQTDVSVPEQLVIGVPSTLAITLKNDGLLPLNDVSLSADTSSNVIFEDIPVVQLQPGDVRDIQIPFRVTDLTDQTNVSFSILPTIRIDEQSYVQERISVETFVVQPRLQFTSAWDAPSAQSGERRSLDVTLRNDGAAQLRNVELLLSVAAANNLGVAPAMTTKRRGADYVIPIDTGAVNLSPGEIKSAAFLFDIKANATPDRVLSIPLRVHATVDGTSLILPFTTAALPIASILQMQKDVRFYTTEGDQIGRGALPLTAGQETSVWVSLSVHNSTSRVENLLLKATVPEGVTWTGNASLSHGSQPSQRGNVLTWRADNLAPFRAAAINLELSLTPEAASRGSIPVLLRDISVSARDVFTGTPLETSLTPLTFQDSQDARLLSKGIKVQ